MLKKSFLIAILFVLFNVGPLGAKAPEADLCGDFLTGEYHSIVNLTTGSALYLKRPSRIPENRWDELNERLLKKFSSSFIYFASPIVVQVRTGWFGRSNTPPRMLDVTEMEIGENRIDDLSDFLSQNFSRRAIQNIVQAEARLMRYDLMVQRQRTAEGVLSNVEYLEVLRELEKEAQMRNLIDETRRARDVAHEILVSLPQGFSLRQGKAKQIQGKDRSVVMTAGGEEMALDILMENWLP